MVPWRSVTATVRQREKGAWVNEATRVLVRVREHLLVPGGIACRGSDSVRSRRGRVVSISSRTDLQGARLERLAVQHLSRQGTLYVARPRKGLWLARPSAASTITVSAQWPPGGACCLLVPNRALAS